MMPRFKLTIVTTIFSLLLAATPVRALHLGYGIGISWGTDTNEADTVVREPRGVPGIISLGTTGDIGILAVRTDLELQILDPFIGFGMGTYLHYSMFDSKLSPYIGIAVGYISEHYGYYSKWKLVPEYAAGFEIHRSETRSVGLEYRYISGDFRFDDTIISNKTNMVMFRFRYVI